MDEIPEQGPKMTLGATWRSRVARRLLSLSVRPIHVIAALPLIGMAVLTPWLLALPIYVDELESKAINSRYLLDGGKLIYLLPSCNGFLEPMPLSWYPARLLDVAIFADMTDPQRLRYWGCAIFLASMFYVSWVAKRTLSLTAPLPSVLGVTWATLSLGVLPFLLVLHRAEQAALVPLLIGCTLPVVSTPNGDARWRSWGFAALYVLLSWFMLAGHTKTVLLLPALLLSAALMIRRWLPVMMLFGAAAFGFIETYRLWQVRYDCPNSPFLAQIYRSVAVSPDDLASGITPFLQRIEVNLLGASKYWRAAEFGLDFQSYWLPSASQVTSVEHVINFMLPALVLLAVLIIVLAIIIELTNKSERFCLSRGTAIAAALLVGLLSLAALQINKNFYEASLQFPVLSLAVLLALPAVLRRTACARTLWSGAIVGLVMLALSSNAALALRLWAELPHWWGKIASRELRQQALGRVIERCGIDKGPNSKRLILDDFAYSVLWRTREPMFMAFFEGWWATGLDQEKLIAERKVSGLIAHCKQFPAKYSGLAVTDQTFCCVNFK